MKSELQPIPGLRCHFGGAVGELLRAVTGQWLLVAPKANPAMLEMFADRDMVPYRDMVPWAGEFAGKYLTSAVQVLRATGDARLRAWIAEFVAHFVRLQDDDGYLGPWPAGCHLTGAAPNVHGGRVTWDAWGHYHVMLGLLLWHDEMADAASADAALGDEALAAACRIGDLLCALFLGAPEVRLVDTGSTEMNLAPVHALAMLHARTGEPRYLALAEQIVGEFAAQGPGGPLAGDYLRQALEGREFFEMPKPRWESLHPIMGLVELYWLTGNAGYREAFERIWWSIVRHDRHNNGGFSSGEKATGNPYDPGAIETCCTIAWLAMSVEMLKLTGDPTIADEIEMSTLNSVLGMHATSGRWATYNTPSDGARFASAHHIVFQARAGSPELNCCSVNSPRGLGMLSDWAVMARDSEIALNYYGPAQLRVPLEPGLEVVITETTGYPVDGNVRIEVTPTRPAEFALRLRIPGWSLHTTVSVNGEPVAGTPAESGTYLTLSRRWEAGDTIELVLDMGLRFWEGQRECAGLTSVYRGPLLLAYDTRYNRDLHTTGKLVAYGGDPGQTTAARLQIPAIDAASLGAAVCSAGRAAWDDWLPPMLLLEARTQDGRTVRLCGFASAGQTGTLYRSWLDVL